MGVISPHMCSGTVPVTMDLLIRVDIGPYNFVIGNCLIRIELILSSLQLFFGFSDFIISKISLESVGLKKSVLLFLFSF